MMQKRKPKLSGNTNGQSLVEFAIALTLILTLVAGAFDLGMAFLSFIALRDAAQEGALFGSVAAVVDTEPFGVYNVGDVLNAGGIEERVRESSTTPVDLSDITRVAVDITTTNPPPCAGNGITVTVSYNYHLTMPLIGTVIGRQTIPITASVTNTILKPACP